MPYVYREAGMEKDGPDILRALIGGAQGQEFFAQGWPFSRSLFKLYAEYRLLRARLADSDQRRAPHFFMDVENGLAGYGEQGSGGCGHPVAFAAAEPEPPVGVLPACIAHAVVQSPAFTADLGQGRAFSPAEIFRGDYGAFH